MQTIGGHPIALYHCSIKVISRGNGRSAIVAAAYRSGTKITNERDGEIHDYTRKRGIATERGNLNREIEISNQNLRQLKARIGKLQNWLKEEQQGTAPTTLADYMQDILKRKAQVGKSSVYNILRREEREQQPHKLQEVDR